MIRRVTLVEPRAPQLHVYSRYPMPRLGTLILGTLLRDRGLDVRVVIESIHEVPWDDLLDTDLLGISTITPTAPRAYDLADRARRAGVPVLMGGPHVTHRPDEALHHADAVARGEAEETIGALVDALGEVGELREAALARIPGVSWRGAGGVRHNPTAPHVFDLDRWPDPDFTLVEGYHQTTGLLGRAVVPIQTSRGCPYACTFCSVTPTFGRAMRYRSTDRVVDEMARHDVDRTHFFFYDDNFAADPRRLRELLNAMDRRLHGEVRFSAQVRADVARDEGMLGRLKEAGCDLLYIGLESVNPASLAAADKRQSVAETGHHLDALRAHGLPVHGMFIFGFDTDGPDTLDATIAFAREHDLFSVQFLLLTPLPGSPWGDEVEASGRLITRDWSRFDTHHVVFEPRGLTPRELQEQQVDGHRRFYRRRDVARRLLRRDWTGAAVRAYARQQNRAWQRDNRDYLQELDLLERTRAAAK